MLFEIFKKYKEIIMYLIFGFLSTIVNLLSYYLMVSTVFNPKNSIELQIANIISWIITIIFVYFTNRKYVFTSSNKNKLKEFFRFFVARVITLLLDMFIMEVGVIILHFNDMIIKILSLFAVIVSNYIFSKLYIFKADSCEVLDYEKEKYNKNN